MKLGVLQKRIMQVLIDGGHLLCLQGMELVNVGGWETELDGAQRFYLCPKEGPNRRVKKATVMSLVDRGLLSVTTEDLRYSKLPRSDSKFTHITLRSHE